MFKWLYKSLNKTQNRSYFGQDKYMLKGMCKAINELPKDGNYQKTRFHFEHIFLWWSDRTGIHPEPTHEWKPSTQGKLAKKMDKLVSGQDPMEINWVSDDTFDLDSINNVPWFHPKVDSYPDVKEALEKAKENYIKSTINISDFFEIRMKHYNDVNPDNKYLELFEGIENIYLKEIKEILNHPVSGIL